MRSRVACAMAILRQLVSTAIWLWRDLPHHTAAKGTEGPGATSGRSAIKIAVHVNRDLTLRIGAVASAGKVVQRGIGPAAVGRTQFEYAPRVVKPVPLGCSVEITSRVHCEVGNGTLVTIERV